MSVTQLMPWTRNRHAFTRSGAYDPFFALHREVNRLFDDVWNGIDTPMLRGGNPTMDRGWPTVDLIEHDNELILSVEMPGMDEKDIDVQFKDQTVILRGERREERDEKKEGQRYSERYFGRFERRIPLGLDIERDKAKAVLRNGVLTITLPKAAQAETELHRIPVSKAA